MYLQISRLNRGASTTTYADSEGLTLSSMLEGGQRVEKLLVGVAIVLSQQQGHNTTHLDPCTRSSRRKEIEQVPR